MERIGRSSSSLGGKRPKGKSVTANAARNLRTAIGRFNLAWRIPISTMTFNAGGEDTLPLPYLSPRDVARFLLNKHPEVLCGGYSCKQRADAKQLLSSFWMAYEREHPGHSIFTEVPRAELCTVVPIMLYGDEGRGRRRGNTAVVSMECFFGFNSADCIQQQKQACCSGCSCDPRTLNKFPGCSSQQLPADDPMKFATLALKEHCYLSRVPLFVVPCVQYKAHPNLIKWMLEQIGNELQDLFHHGVDVSGETFKVAVLGMKGDMKWFAAIGCLTRYHGKKGRKRSFHMCNECLAGVASMPYEDMSFRPKWARSLWAERPWDGELNPPPLLVVPFDQSAPERMYRRDVFHITKQGVWRHFIGSVLVVLVQWRYFKVRGESNAAPVQLQRAHSYFVMWCGAFRKIPALRSFTKALLMWKSAWAYPWANVKGSDSTLLMKWLADWLPSMVREARHHEHAEIFEIMCQTAKAGAEFMGDMYNHGAWLSRPCAMKMYESGDKFLTGYTLLAQRFLKMNFCAFNLIPKCHMMKHVLVDTMLALTHGDEYTLNPMTMGCEVNEDLIDKTCRLSRRLDTRTMQRRLLELYLVKAKAVHKRAKARLYG